MARIIPTLRQKVRLVVGYAAFALGAVIGFFIGAPRFLSSCEARCREIDRKVIDMSETPTMHIDPKIRGLKDRYAFDTLGRFGSDTPAANAGELLGIMMRGAAQLNSAAWTNHGHGLDAAHVTAGHRVAGRELVVHAAFEFPDQPDNPDQFQVRLRDGEAKRFVTLDRAMKCFLN